MSLSGLGSMVGSLSSFHIRYVFGPRLTCIIVIAGSLTLGYLLLAFAYSVWMVYSGRVVMGFGLGLAR